MVWATSWACSRQFSPLEASYSKVDDDRLLVTGLFVEVRGMAASPDAAVEQLAGWALPHFQVIATAGNGAIDEPADMVV